MCACVSCFTLYPETLTNRIASQAFANVKSDPLLGRRVKWPELPPNSKLVMGEAVCCRALEAWLWLQLYSVHIVCPISALNLCILSLLILSHFLFQNLKRIYKCWWAKMFLNQFSPAEKDLLRKKTLGYSFFQVMIVVARCFVVNVNVSVSRVLL